MPDPFKSARLKLDRAQHHLNAITAVEGRLRSSRRCRIVIEESSDPNFLNFVLRLPVPRASLSILVGDCLHNFRSALDHLVYALAEFNAAKAGHERNDSELVASMFPICLSETGYTAFQKQCDRQRLNWVPPQAIEVIKQFQPKGVTEPLWILNVLENIDKHRKLNLASVGTTHLKIDTGGSFFEASNTMIPYRNGETVFGEQFDDPSKVIATADITLHVTLQDGPVTNVGIVPVLQALLLLTRGDIVPALEPFVR